MQFFEEVNMAQNIYCKATGCLKFFTVEEGKEEGYVGTGAGYFQYYNPTAKELQWLCPDCHLVRAEHIHQTLKGA
jgi:hypothetical protein